MSFQVDSHRFDVSIDDVRPDPLSLYPTVNFPLIFSHKSTTWFNIINLNFMFRIRAQNYYHYVGPLIFDSSFITLSGQNTVTERVRLILDQYGIRKIEELRENGDIQFNIDCCATILDQNNKRLKCQSNLDGKIAKSDWVEKFLPTFKYKEVVLLEVPKLDISEFSKVAELLNDAWKKKSMGQFSDVLVDCRRALEFITKEVKKKGFKTEDGNPDWNRFLGDKELGDINATIVQKLSGFVAPGAHLYGKAFNIEDAEYALMITYAIANYVLNKLKRNL